MKPKILFVYDHPKPEWWMDGLWAALNLLEEDFEIQRLNLQTDDQKTITDDFVLGWGAFGSKVDKWIQERYRDLRPRYTGLCIAGNAMPPTTANEYNILFYETDWIKDNYLRGVATKTVKAFGINTDIFSPIDLPTPILWDYIGVGALATWKRWERMADKPGTKLVIGEYQNENETESLEIARTLLKKGVMVSNSLNPLDLVSLLHCARTLYMPSTLLGGGERSVLEARSCGLSVLVEDDNPKLKELVDCPIPSHHDYAKALKEGVMSVL